MIVIARSRELIANHMAQAMLRMCAQHGTAPGIVDQASRLLEALEAG